MDETTAQQLADSLGGETWNTGGDLWLVLKKRTDGSIVAISDESIVIYENQEALEAGTPTGDMLLI